MAMTSKEIEKILDNSVEPSDKPILYTMNKDKAVKAILALIQQAEHRAVDYTLDSLASIEYPPSGKTYHFKDDYWVNSKSMAVNDILEGLKGETK